MRFRDFNIETDWPLFELSENESYKATSDGSDISEELLKSRKMDIESFIKKDNFYVKILLIDDEICGIIIAGVHLNDGVNIGFIYNIYISEDHRKKGFGSLAMEKAIKFCKSKNCVKMALNVGAKNTDAISLYKNLGFEPTNMAMELPLC